MTNAPINTSLIGDGRTIVALATPPGRSALAIIRASGPAVQGIARALLRPAPEIDRRMTHCFAVDAAGEVIDDVVATIFRGPHSFTGEDMLEVSTHGGFVVPATVLAATIRAGARYAEPGEFTRRAVLNGKLDLLQAEAIGDLIDARSSAAHRLALVQLDGGLSRRIESLRQQLLQLEALLVYDIDFPEEDDGPIPRARIFTATEELQHALGTLLASEHLGTLVHNGALVVLVGAPNVGKSSLFNALLGEARAIVTDVPGTTRDAIEAVLDLPDWPLRLVDTAGLRETRDPIEQLGVETASRYLARATVVLVCVDSPDAAGAAARIREEADAIVITVATKGDIVTESVKMNADVVVSAWTGEGLGALLELIAVRLTGAHGIPTLDAPILTRVRHRAIVEIACAEVDEFLVAWLRDGLPVAVAATHLHAAVGALSELIGVVVTDDVLDVVFRSFCVGK